MSRLQAALRAYPDGSYLHGGVSAINQPLIEAEARAREAEIRDAKSIQVRTGCSWTDAIRQARAVCGPSDSCMDVV